MSFAHSAAVALLLALAACVADGRYISNKPPQEPLPTIIPIE